jgi:hypothetical protein
MNNAGPMIRSREESYRKWSQWTDLLEHKVVKTQIDLAHTMRRCLPDRSDDNDP